MKKIIQSIPVLLTLLAIGFLYFSNWCIDSIPSCYSSSIHQIYQHFTNPLYLFALYSLPLAFILILIPRHIFNSWLKLAAWMVPLAFIFIATQPVVAGFLSTDRNDAARLAAEVLTVFSLILIIYKYFTSRRNSEKI